MPVFRETAFTLLITLIIGGTQLALLFAIFDFSALVRILSSLRHLTFFLHAWAFNKKLLRRNLTYDLYVWVFTVTTSDDHVLYRDLDDEALDLCRIVFKLLICRSFE